MRKSGVLMHLSSLPSPHGIGTMGEAALDFLDFLQKAGQTYWQLLPICPTSYGDSPYQSFSSYAGNPYFIDLDQLEKDGLLEKQEYAAVDWESAPDDINYGALYRKRYAILRKAAGRFLSKQDNRFNEFCEKNAYWLEDYALFMSLKDAFDGRPWTEWEQGLCQREESAILAATERYKTDILFWKILQYLFFRQWTRLRAYGMKKGIRLIGDMPIYISLDSVEVWAHPKLFQLDEDRQPKAVAGCPPDGFSDTGQLWGNPLFDWESMAENGYSWWVDRIRYLCGIYDVLRIDHFRGFDSYYAIPRGEPDARNGHWEKGPGIELFRTIEKKIGRPPIIAEDLGFMTDSVKKLLRETGFPGMKVLEFAFDSRDPNGASYLPKTYIPNCVAYTGTHDNDTVNGWMASADPKDVARAKQYLGLNSEEGYNWGMMRVLWNSNAGLTIVQAQDLLGLGSESRMNTPSTVGKNWRWRALPGSFSDDLANKIREEMKGCGRLADEKQIE